MKCSRALRGTALGFGVFVASACAGAGDGRDGDALGADSDAQVTANSVEAWRFRHHPPAAGGTTAASGGSTASGGSSASGGSTSTGGSSTSGGTGGSGGIPPATCDLCTTTQACCNAVNAGALCTFSADTCSSLDAGRQHTYAVDCLMTLRTIISAWELGGVTPPAVCALPE